MQRRLTGVTGGSTPLTIAYDPSDRIRQTAAGPAGAQAVTQFLYDGDRLVAEYDGTSGALLRRYVHGVGTDEPLVWYEGPNGTADKRWLLSDHQGSIVGWSKPDGTLGASYTYGPYGEPQTWSGSRFRYTGQIALSEAQVYHYKARAYDPGMGRFLQTDPIGQADDPNLYAYVKDDPVDRSDPTGLACTGTLLCDPGKGETVDRFSAGASQLGPGSAPNAAAVDRQKVGQVTVGQASNILTNESRDLSGGAAGQLAQAKAAQANAIINSELLKHPRDMASDVLSKGAAASLGRADDQIIMRQAYLDRLAGKPDPVGGRTYFGNSVSDIRSRPIGIGRQTVFKQFGPFDHGNGPKQYIYIYNDPTIPGR